MKNRVHLICNAHLDPVWQWRWTEGCSEAIATFRNAVDIIGEYPELTFNHNEAILYQWVQKYDPGLFRAIRELVSQNRWFIAGGWYLQPDVNLPPYENLERHIRYGREYFKNEFGVEPRVAYNFDSFGHPAGLPRLLRDFGYELYIHQRPEKEFLKLPDSLYVWKGIGDKSIPAYRIEIGLYHTERKNIQQRLSEATELSLKLGRDVALFWGLGDHGGGATRIDLDRIREFTAGETRVEFLHSTTDRFFEAIKPLVPTLPVYEGSLQRVFAGCYTSLARIKRKAVEVSAAAVQAERLAGATPNHGMTTSNHGMTTPNPLLMKEGAPSMIDSRLGVKEIFCEVWADILFNDFHDILPGSCTEPAEQDALDLYGRAMENIRRLNMGSITGINQASEPLKAHIPVTLFNSNPGLSTFPVEFECMSDYRPFWEGEWILKLYDRQGNEIPCQEEQPDARLPFHRWRRRISFLAKDLPAGVHHFRLEPEEVSNPSANPEETSPNPEVTTPNPAVTTPNPLLIKEGAPSMTDSRLGEVSFLVLNDTADSWGTNTFSWRDAAGRFEPETPERIIESGPVRTITESVLTWHHSKIIVHKILYSDWPVTEYKIRVHWNEERLRLKLAIPAPAENCRLTAQIPGGSEEFPADGGEYVHGTWLELWTEDGGRKTEDARHASRVTHHDSSASRITRHDSSASRVTRHDSSPSLVTRHSSLLHIAHNGLHGFDFEGREVRLSLLRSAAYCHEQGYNLDNGRSHRFMDQGVHEVRLALWNEGPAPDAVAEWLAAPPLVWPHLPVG